MADGAPRPDSVSVAAVQMDPHINAVAQNLRSILDRVREATENGAKLVVFPECALTGYGFESKAEAWAVAETIPGPSTSAIAATCAETRAVVVVGLLEQAGDDLFNVAAVIDGSGVIATYRKIHLPFLGVDRFTTPGDRPFAVVEAAGLRLGLHICYDGTFPRVGPSSHAARGRCPRLADQLAHPVKIDGRASAADPRDRKRGLCHGG